MGISALKKLFVILVVFAIPTASAFGGSETSAMNDAHKKQVIEEFNLLHYNSRVWARTTWLGVTAMQNPCDMWIMQEIISKVRPDFVIETGTAKGGSCLFFAMVLAQVNSKGRVITVDIRPDVEDASKFEIFRERVEVIKGDSVSPEVIKRMADRVRGRTVLVTLDSLHTKNHVLKELELYSGSSSKCVPHILLDHPTSSYLVRCRA